MNASPDKAMDRSLLTATRLGAMRRCPRQHYYRYELGLSRIRQADALRLGRAFHVGLEAHSSGPLFHSEEGIANILDEVTRLALRVWIPALRQGQSRCSAK